MPCPGVVPPGPPRGRVTVVKQIHALWGSDQQALLSPELGEELRRLGASRLQVNLDDHRVADAQLRLTAFDRAPDAVVSVWSEDGDTAGPVADALGRYVATVAGWTVEERVPLEPPAATDGQPLEALSNVAFLRRPDEMTPEAWRSRWLEHHTRVAIDTQATFGYVQNVVTAHVTGPEDLPRVDGIVEELFPLAATTDLHAFYGSGGDEDELARRLQEMMASVGTFGADRDLTVLPTTRRTQEL